MNLAEAQKLVGDERLWLAPGGTEKVLVGIRVVDARTAYGRAQLRIEPLSGRGRRWVDVESTQGLEDRS